MVTGGSSGIGAALIAKLVEAGALVCNFDISDSVQTGVKHIHCDVTDEIALSQAIDDAQIAHGPIDLYFSNAGVLSHQSEGAASASNADWELCWAVNVMAHVYASRRLIPAMKARGTGYFVIVASAAGLLNQIGDAAYSATKHAAVSFGESLAITHGDEGIGVSLLCPQYVATPLIDVSAEDSEKFGSLLTADEVASVTLNAVESGKFLVLPHSEVERYAMLRAQDCDKWIGGMRKLRSKALHTFGDAHVKFFYRLV